MEDPERHQGRPFEPSRWVEALDYVWFAERYHWTPAQVDELPLGLANSIPDVAGVLDEIRDEAREKAEADAEREAARRR
ncbi:hypothetical protein ACIRH0_04175 [Streptomyces sp. NPDC093675]|uniref:hypothetical protein n=1 Tax=Streptomyces sp. NPDC093675 TaxID=3366049 RepID=UPI00380C0816